MSMNGVHRGLRLPVRMLATSEARCPTVRPAASTTYHFRLPASSFPLGKYVDIVNYPCFQRIKRERVEYRSARKVVKLGNLVALSAPPRTFEIDWTRSYKKRGSPVFPKSL